MILRTQGMRALLVGAVLSVAAAASAETLTQVEIRSAGEASRIILHVEGVVTHKAFVLTNPDRLVVDLVGVENAVRVTTRSVPGGPVKTVRIAQFANDPQPITRVVADLRGASDHSVERQGDNLVLQVSPRSVGASSTDVAASAAPKSGLAAKDSGSIEKSVTPTAVAQARPAVKESEDTVSKVVPVPVTPVQKSVTSHAQKTASVDKNVDKHKVGESVVSPAVAPKAAVVQQVEKAPKTGVVEPKSANDDAVDQPVEKSKANVDRQVDSRSQKSSKSVKAVAVPHQTKAGAVATEAAVVPTAVDTNGDDTNKPVAKPIPVPQTTVAPRPVAAQPTVPVPTNLGQASSVGVSRQSKNDSRSWNTQTYTEDSSPKLNLTATSRRINLDVQGADIRTVLRTLADYAGMNIIASRDVQGEVSASLKDAPWESALESILRAHGYGYVQENGIIRVGVLERIRSEELDEAAAARKREDLLPIETRVVHMEFANAEELKGSLVEMMTGRGKLQVDARTNALIISDIPNRVELIAQMAQQLDSRTPQVEIVSKIVDISNEDSQNLGIEWSAANLMAGEVLGGAGVSASTAGAAGGMRLGTVQSWGQLDLMLDALASQKKANVISNPTITTVNNREAKILVGSKIPLIVADEAGNAITQLTTIGIQMRVTPHVNSDNTISLDLHPEISELSSKATVQGGVIINTSEADTRVIVQDGETAIIGGLIRDNKSEVKTGIPVLQDIPLVGWLFRNSNMSDDKREMIIFVTPRLITGDLGQG